MSHSELNRCAMAYEPIVGGNRAAIATRLSFVPVDGTPISLERLYPEIAALWPDSATPVLIDAGGVSPTVSIQNVKPVPHIWVEVPGAVCDGPSGFALIEAMQRAGFTLVLRGRPAVPVPTHLLSAFKLALIHVSEDRRLRDSDDEIESSRARHAGQRQIPYAQEGVDSIELMERCFKAGAEAVIGWPFADAVNHAGSARTSPDFSTITKLLQMLNRGDDPAPMEEEIKRDPALAFRLLRYINSPAFGLRVEIQSFRHALMMLGYKNLKKWLSLLLATASKNANLRPVMFASFRRGLFLERLVGGNNDEQTRDEAFLLGIFSLLDKLFNEPLDELLPKLNLPERVLDTLIGDGPGPYGAYLRVAEAVEYDPQHRLDELLTNAFLTREQCNAALVHALTAPAFGSEAA